MRLRSLAPWLIKTIGVVIFLWILSHIDRTALVGYLRSANVAEAVVAFGFLLLMYVAKAVRWHVLVRTTGLRPSWHASWKLFNVGIFLGAITPSNLGELGRAAYLRQEGIHGATAFSLIVMDRTMDVIVMGSVGVAGLGILFGTRWLMVGIVMAIIGILLFLLAWRSSRKLRHTLPWLQFLATFRRLPWLLPAIAATIFCWIFYFCWTILLARSLGIHTAAPVLISALTLTGILSLIPISPSGLGTREAALLAFLSPYGVIPAQTVAYALLIFAMILTSSLIGGWYLIREPLPLSTSPIRP